jgi:hypothetical protein
MHGHGTVTSVLLNKSRSYSNTSVSFCTISEKRITLHVVTDAWFIKTNALTLGLVGWFRWLSFVSYGISHFKIATEWSDVHSAL